MAPMRARSVQYLLNEAARVLAEVEDHIWDGRTLPVPIEAIAEDHYGLLIRELGEISTERPELAPHGAKLSGALIPDRAEIWVDATEASRSPRRRRYTIAHELGHWELHRGPTQTFCREAAIDPIDAVAGQKGASPETWAPTAELDEPAIEWEANIFGGALLLPPWLVREVWDETHSVEALAERFDCSLSAVEPGWQAHYGFLGNG